MPPKRPPWADEDDSSSAATAVDPAAAAPARRPGVPPFGVFLRAFLNGLADAAVSRESMRCIQAILQHHPQSATLLQGSCLWYVIFYIDLNPATKAHHVIAYLVAAHNNSVEQHQRTVWLQALRLESLVDFPYPILWTVLYPHRALPPARKP